MALNLTFVVCMAALLGSSSAQIEGKYTFESQDNFAEFLNAVEVPAIKIPFIVALRPEVSIVREGESYVATSITPIKTNTNKFTDGEIKEFDFFGSDKTTQFTTEIVGDEKVISKNVDDDSFIVTRVFTATQMIMNMKFGDVAASRTFNRVL